MSLKNYCRLCFEEKANYYTSLVEKETAKMFNSLTKIQIETSDKISVSICINCFKELETAFNIQQKILNAEARHQEELLADFLIENHDELRNELLIPYTFNKLQLGETADGKVINNNNSSVIEKDTLDDSQVKFTCEICSAKFRLSVEFLQHIGEHETRKCTHSAEDVPIGKYKEHVTQHSCEINESDILCEKCGEVSTDTETHGIHMKSVHIGEYICESCSADFFKISELQQHIKSTHSGMKPFVCDVCHETFALRYVLQLHKLQHTHDSPYVCEFCSRKFKYSCSLKIHLKTKHDDAHHIE